MARYKCNSCGATLDSDATAASLGYSPAAKISFSAPKCGNCGSADLLEIKEYTYFGNQKSTISSPSINKTIGFEKTEPKKYVFGAVIGWLFSIIGYLVLLNIITGGEKASVSNIIFFSLLLIGGVLILILRYRKIGKNISDDLEVQQNEKYYFRAIIGWILSILGLIGLLSTINGAQSDSVYASLLFSSLLIGGVIIIVFRYIQIRKNKKY